MSFAEPLAALRRFLERPAPAPCTTTFQAVLTFRFTATSSRDNVKATMAFDKAVADGLDDQLIRITRTCWRQPVCVLVELDTKASIKSLNHLRHFKHALRELGKGNDWLVLGSSNYLCMIEHSSSDEPAPIAALAHRLFPESQIYTGLITVTASVLEIIPPG